MELKVIIILGLDIYSSVHIAIKNKGNWILGSVKDLTAEGKKPIIFLESEKKLY